MKVIKKLFTKTIDKKEKVLPSYFLVLDNGKKIMIRPCFKEDWKLLDFVSELVRNE